MRLEHRVKRLERAAGVGGSCRACGGKGPAPRVIVWRRDLEPER